MLPADFLTGPSDIAAGMDLFTDYIANEGVEAENRAALLADLEHLSHAYALATLDRLGWQREAGASVDSEDLRQRLQVGDEHVRLFRRLLEMQVRTGVLTEADDGFVVAVGSEDPLPDDAEAFAGRMAAQYEHGSNEIGHLTLTVESRK